jgi:branched-chain amino acid aminotransferase
MEAHKEVVRANKLESCYIRPIAFYGSEKMGVSPKGAKVHVAIAAWPWGAYLGEDGLAKGIRVKTSSFARHHVNVSMCRAKYSGTYANSILANMEATDTATTRRCCSTSTASWPKAPARTCSWSRTADLRAGTRLGADRHHPRHGDPAGEGARLRGQGQAPHPRRPLHRRRAFFTGTAAEVTPIREVDGRRSAPASAARSPKRSRSLFFDVVNGRVPAHQDWLAKV